MKNRDLILTLSKLIKTCAKGQESFRSAADGVQNFEFRRLFNIFSQQRSQFIAELQAEIHRLGGETVRGNEKPDQISSRREATAADDAAIVLECGRMEKSAVNDYQEALKSDLPPDVQYIVRRQLTDIKDAYDRIRILQRAA